MVSLVLTLQPGGEGGAESVETWEAATIPTKPRNRSVVTVLAEVLGSAEFAVVAGRAKLSVEVVTVAAGDAAALQERTILTILSTR